MDNQSGLGMVNYRQTVYDWDCNKPKNSKRYFTVQKKCDKKSRPKNNVRGDDKLMIFFNAHYAKFNRF